MVLLRDVLAQLREMSSFSKKTIKFGTYLMFGCYILSIFSFRLAETAPNYFATLAMAQGFGEVAPACFAASVCAGLICDLIIKFDLKQ